MPDCFTSLVQFRSDSDVGVQGCLALIPPALAALRCVIILPILVKLAIAGLYREKTRIPLIMGALPFYCVEIAFVKVTVASAILNIE